jgi:hypothetical protein
MTPDPARPTPKERNNVLAAPCRPRGAHSPSRLPGLIFGTPRAKPCHQAAGETTIAASPSRRPEGVRSAVTAVWMNGSRFRQPASRYSRACNNMSSLSASRAHSASREARPSYSPTNRPSAAASGCGSAAACSLVICSYGQPGRQHQVSGAAPCQLTLARRLPEPLPCHPMRSTTQPRSGRILDLGYCGAMRCAAWLHMGPALPSHGRGHRFETCHAHQHKPSSRPGSQRCLPEDLPENHRK